MDFYETRSKIIPGTKYSEVYPQAMAIYKTIASKTKRRPYVRSMFFNMEKVFLDYFWAHIREKNFRDRTRRLRYYACAIDLVRYGRIEPVSSRNIPGKKSEMFYRFAGKHKSGEFFFVQIKKDSREQKHLISIFPK